MRFLPLAVSAGFGLVHAPLLAANDFSCSFEEGESVVVLENRPEKASGNASYQSNVVGLRKNALMKMISSVAASSDNPPYESVTAVMDGSPGSKWLTFQASGWIKYRLSEGCAVGSYRLTSGDDHPERDPKKWRVLGSDDGESWTVLDRRENQSWGSDERGVTKSYDLNSSHPYTHYQLEISEVQGGGILQLADWILVPRLEKKVVAPPMTTRIGTGPTVGYNIKRGVGFTGMRSLRYAGKHTADGRGYAMNRLFDVEIPVGKRTRLSYNIFPELSRGDLQYPSTYAALNLRFSDGTQLSGLNALDAYEFPATALGQGRSKILYPDQWNHVRIDVGSVAEGKTITAIQFCYDNDGATANTTFAGWIDDIRIEAEPKRIDGSSLTHYVDTRRGTNSSGAFSRGSNEAITAIPNGFNFLVPLTNAQAQAREYSYHEGNNEENKTPFEGLGISHQPSPWMGDRNQFSVMPVPGADAPSGDWHERGTTLSHDRETAQPDYYGVDLDNGVKAEMTPSNRGMVMQFTFPGDAGSVVLDSPTPSGGFSIDQGTGRVSGWVSNSSGFLGGQTPMYIAGSFDQMPTATGMAEGGREMTKYATFNTEVTKTISLRLATSLISVEQARRNLAMEIGDASFDEVRERARAEWNERLGVIRVEGASETELVTLYGCLYRLNVYPNAHFENVGTIEEPEYQYASPVSRLAKPHTSIHTGARVVSGKMYVNNGFWDTYRTTWPAYALLYPDLAAELIDGFVEQYRDGGWIARWSSPGYANCMTGTSSDVAFADAYLRGVELPDPLATYDAALKNATTPSTNRDVGRNGLTTSIFLGYTPESEHESVSWATEGFINDFGIGNMAAALAEDPATPDDRRAELREHAEYFLNRSLNYVKLFDPRIEFFQARHADGRFAVSPEDYDPTVWFGPYTETNGWNFAYHAPHDPNGLANLYGGRKGLEKKLDVFFSTPETSRGPIHEEVEARDARFGQWGVSNQVSHHVPFIYNAAGAPAKAQKIVREALQRSYAGSEIGQGYAGDEDNGEMSAWYIFNALGLYPLQVGSTQLVVGSPLFEKATVNLKGGRTLEIRAPGNTPQTVYVQSVKVDGAEYGKTTIDSELFRTGGVIEYVLGETPSNWGRGPNDGPPSLTTGRDLAKPMGDTTGIAAVKGDQGSDLGRLFDNTSETEHEFGAVESVITLTYEGAKPTPRFYTLTSASKAADPTGWVLEGSDNGTRWTKLDEREGVAFRHRRETQPFKIHKPGAFRSFRLTLRGESPAMSLSEIELLSSEGEDVLREGALSEASHLH